jgi:hypothetical protein
MHELGSSKPRTSRGRTEEPELDSWPVQPHVHCDLLILYRPSALSQALSFPLLPLLPELDCLAESASSYRCGPPLVSGFIAFVSISIAVASTKIGLLRAVLSSPDSCFVPSLSLSRAQSMPCRSCGSLVPLICN